MSAKLTKKIIDRAVYEGDTHGTEWDVRWDSLIPGFGVRLYPSGRKAFILRYRTQGRKRLFTIGTYGPITLEQARAQAKQRIGEVIQGEDPVEQRKKERQGETVRHLCEAYLERHASRKRSARDDQRRIAQHLLPAWANRKIDSVTRADVAALHSRIGERHPYEANRTVALLGKMFELARRWGFLPENAANPARGIDKFSGGRTPQNHRLQRKKHSPPYLQIVLLHAHNKKARNRDPDHGGPVGTSSSRSP